VGGVRAQLTGADGILRGLASKAGDGTLSIFLTNYAVAGTPDSVSRMEFANAPEGAYRLTVRRVESGLDKTAEDRMVYVHSDFRFDVFTPADTVVLIQLKPQM